MPKLGQPYWLARVPRNRRPGYDRQRGDLDVEVAIVGGGLTGCVTAYTFAAAGVPVAVLEAARIGEGSTAASPGLLLLEPPASFAETAAAYGLRAARRMWQLWRRGALDFAATLRRLRIRCELAPADLYEVAVAPGDEKALRRSYEARRAAGLEVAWIRGAEVARRARVGARGAVRVSGGAVLDPYQASIGLARAALRRGALVFQDSGVAKIRPHRRDVEITTERGRVRARTVILATGIPVRGFKPLNRHFRLIETYTVLTAPLPTAVRREIGSAGPALCDASEPPHYLRWMPDARLLFAGADQPRPSRPGLDRVVRQRTGQLMYELSLLYPAMSGIPADYGWSASLAATPDGLPFIGPHRNYPRHLFALGAGTAGVAAAALAGRLLLRHYQAQPAKGDELFDFTRRT